jgi:hypothetical protein
LLCGKFGFDFAPDHVEWNPPLRRLVGGSFVEEALERDTVSELFHFVIEII